MTEQPMPQAHLGPLVQPAPVACAVGIFTPNGTTDNLIAITAETANGTFVFMLPPDIATKFGEAIIQNARQAGTGLIIPTQPIDIRHNPNGAPGL